VQVVGTTPEQLKFTALEYPASAVSVPLKIATCKGNIVCDEFEIKFV
jgi:hypothetical protein